MFHVYHYLLIAALCSPAKKGLASWLSGVLSFVFIVTFPHGIPGQIWYLIVLIPPLHLYAYSKDSDQFAQTALSFLLRTYHYVGIYMHRPMY